jgi:hypothetical protein
MARRRGQTVSRDGGELILPRHLADQTGLSAEQYREFNAERRAWFKARGIDPGDWREVYPVLKASWEAHGINRGAQRRRLLLKDEVR